MKFRSFKASDGDAVLIEGDQTNLLIDGGRKGAFEDHVVGTLEELEQAGKKLDLLCVSHIDEDHISGIVELVRRRREWLVHDFQITPPSANEPAPNPNHPEPSYGRPPVIDHVWHNGFGESFDQAAANGISNQLNLNAQFLAASAALAETVYGEKVRRLQQGAAKGIELQLALAASPMGITVNDPSGGELLEVTDPPQTIEFPGMKIRLLGPSHGTLEAVEKEWDKWVANNAATIEELKAEFQSSASVGTGNALDFLTFAARRLENRIRLADAEELREITPPNLASIMFLVEEGGKSVLMTGDGASSDLVNGLGAHGLLDASTGGMHVDVLKVAHHGALANTTVDFARLITADHYVFCGNGRHDNPEEQVIERYVESRVSTDPAIKSPNAEADGAFKLWFNYHPDDEEIEDNDNYIRVLSAVRSKAESLQSNDPNRFTIEFSQADFFEIPL